MSAFSETMDNSSGGLSDILGSLREITNRALGHLKGCTVQKHALIARHMQKDAPVSNSDMETSRRTLHNVMDAFSYMDATAQPAQKQRVIRELLKAGNASNTEMMNHLEVTWADPMWAEDPFWTFGHEAAKQGLLPDNFSQWEHRSRTGATVAHIAAEHGGLPASFNKWTITRGDGWTVAHEAATSGHLPASVDPAILDWSDRYGKTVRQVMADHDRCAQAVEERGPRFN